MLQPLLWHIPDNLDLQKIRDVNHTFSDFCELGIVNELFWRLTWRPRSVTANPPIIWCAMRNVTGKYVDSKSSQRSIWAGWTDSDLSVHGQLFNPCFFNHTTESKYLGHNVSSIYMIVEVNLTG